MNEFFNYKIFSLAIYVGIFIACNSKEPSTLTPTPEEDTRQLVKLAFDSVDRSRIGVLFNAERVEKIRAQLETETNPNKKTNLTVAYASELLKSGNTSEAIRIFEQILSFIAQNNLHPDSTTKRNLLSMTAMAYMRQGEVENCVQNHNHQSCFLPIAGEGVHKLQSGSRGAIQKFEEILKAYPNDLESKYLLNVAYMTLGEYPGKVPSAYRINPSWFQSKIKMQPFKDIAPALGINRNGLAGGVVMDDFTNDGWLDIAVTSWGPNDQMRLYINNGDGTFSDQTTAFGLEGHVSGLNLNQTDFNNDGWIDLYIMRGAWFPMEGDIPNTLLMNTGKGSFVDVTIKAGLTHHAPTQTSAWTDIDLDGWLDLIVGNESLPNYERGIDVYINQKDGTFLFKPAEYGLTLNRFFKGCVATDVNNDKYPDMYFSSLHNGAFLFINQEKTPGKRFYVQAGPASGISDPQRGFPSFSFDYDNDGLEDLFTSSFINDESPAYHWMTSHMGKAKPEYLPKLYHNKGNLIFDEVGVDMGLTEIAFTMGCNYGDINTDGYLDFYLATGNPLYQSIVPNKMYLNMQGRKFEDVSYSGGFANIQKGHGVAFGDPDHDGDEDIYAVIGGAYEGDMFYNCFFENPNEHNNNWIVLKLAGVRANKPAIGARV
ncbi:MAG TPA: VCBS repeat-containing protein, partial [Saprospiraceae bacterium]|nr:VCBS repeat-containing protein [Saprospiraceae bacterium]